MPIELETDSRRSKRGTIRRAHRWGGRPTLCAAIIPPKLGDSSDAYHPHVLSNRLLLNIFPRLVFGCINADFCNPSRIIQRFSSSAFLNLLSISKYIIPEFCTFSTALQNAIRQISRMKAAFCKNSFFMIFDQTFV